MKWVLRYRIENLREIRGEFRQLCRERTPLLVCSNHLTYIDSVLLIYAFGNHWWYFANFRCLSWNLPALEYKNNPFFRVVCFLAKCLFIDREGSREHHLETLEVARRLLEAGEVVTIFPEGRRSKTGKFDGHKLAYGTGRIVLGLPKCRVLCVYLRSDSQSAKSSFPRRSSRFTLLQELVTFENPAPAGDEAERRERIAAITRGIAGRIQDLEKGYFAASTASAAAATSR